jgi:thiol-disulfide isomerase/thioredoxin
VLVDFWTYSCINCIRTLPYLKGWYAKYHDKGFEIIGVHSPEFQFEHDLANVQAAVVRYDIHYPVALDNQFTTWQNFQNRYWPAHYLVDKEGNVVYQHFGEGEYDITENNIRFLLGLGKMTSAKTEKENIFIQQTPETYLGYERAQRFTSPELVIHNQPVVYSYPVKLDMNEWALKGKWVVSAEKIVSADVNAAIKLHFSAAKVYAVMGNSIFPVNVSILLNGELKNKIRVDQNKLYTLVDLSNHSDGIIEMSVEGKGLEVYTFTFGSE